MGGSVSNEELIARLRAEGAGGIVGRLTDAAADALAAADAEIERLRRRMEHAWNNNDEVLSVRAERDLLRKALEEVQFMDCCGETREYVDEILDSIEP